MDKIGELIKVLGEVAAALTAVALSINGLIAILVNKIIPILHADHPALPLVKLLGSIVNRDQVTDKDRPSSPPSSPLPPAAAAILLLCLLAAPAQAQTVSVSDVLTKAGATEGIMLDVKTGHGLNYLAATVWQGTGKLKYLSVTGGIVSTDGFGASGNIDIGNALPKINFPVLSLVNYLKVGIGGAYRTTTVHTDTIENSKADDKWLWGPTVFVKWAF